jgi:hypothetical protein
MASAAEWLDAYRSFWEGNLDSFTTFVEARASAEAED